MAGRPAECSVGSRDDQIIVSVARLLQNHEKIVGAIQRSIEHVLKRIRVDQSVLHSSGRSNWFSRNERFRWWRPRGAYSPSVHAVNEGGINEHKIGGSTGSLRRARVPRQ